MAHNGATIRYGEQPSEHSNEESAVALAVVKSPEKACDSLNAAVADAGSVVADAGSAVTDAGSAAADAGSLMEDAGSLMADAGERADNAFASAVLEACGLLATDFPECPHLAAANSWLVAQCAEGPQTKRRLVHQFAVKFSHLIPRAATACDADVLEHVFALDEAQSVDLRTKYFEYDEDRRACLVAHLQAVCRLGSSANIIHQTSSVLPALPSRIMDMAKEMSQTLTEDSDLGQIFSATLPKAFAIMSSMSEAEQNSMTGVAQRFGLPGAGAAPNMSGGDLGMDLGGMVDMMKHLFGSFSNNKETE